MWIKDWWRRRFARKPRPARPDARTTVVSSRYPSQVAVTPPPTDMAMFIEHARRSNAYTDYDLPAYYTPADRLQEFVQLQEVVQDFQPACDPNAVVSQTVESADNYCAPPADFSGVESGSSTDSPASSSYDSSSDSSSYDSGSSDSS